jgi:hypothetical protein
MTPGIFFSKLRNLSFQDILYRIQYRLSNGFIIGIRRIVDRVISTEISDKRFLKLLKCNNYDQFSAMLHDWKQQGLGLYTGYIPNDNWDGWRIIKKYNNESIDHKFNLLGSGLINIHYDLIDCKGFEGQSYHIKTDSNIESEILDKIQLVLSESSYFTSNYRPIDWKLDFTSGFRWHNVWYMDVEIGVFPGADIKVPWELSRFYHLPRLALEYKKTKNEGLVKECVLQITDWIIANPVRYGPNWRVSMEVAIRACNWLLAFDMIRSSPNISNRFLIMFTKSLTQHTQHILSNLECSKGIQSNNHYMANLLGLVHLGLSCPWLPGIDNWMPKILSSFKDEIHAQFHNDGVNIECSSQYHRLTLEMVLHNLLALKKISANKNFKNKSIIGVIEKILGDDTLKLIHKAVLFSKHIQNKNGIVPQFGDNDSGRIFNIVPPESDKDHRHLVSLATCIFPDVLCDKVNVWNDEAKLFGNVDSNHIPHHNVDSETGFLHYADGGVSVYKDEVIFLVIQTHKGYAGHAHNDLFSFEFHVDGIPFLVDGGSYCYTNGKVIREKFRSSYYHNTLCVPGLEQNIHPGLFDILPMAEPYNLIRKSKEVSACHNAYETPHSRNFYIDNTRLIITDCYKGESACHLNLAPAVSYEIHEDMIILKNINKSLKIQLKGFSIVKSEPGCYSAQYGKKIKNTLLILHRNSLSTEMAIEVL